MPKRRIPGRVAHIPFIGRLYRFWVEGKKVLRGNVCPRAGGQIRASRACDEATAGFAANGFSELSPGKYTLVAALLTEVVMTAFFLIVIPGATDGRGPRGLAPVAIGLALTLIHLVSIPVTNTSVNPARSTGAALFQGGLAMQQLWLSWLAPAIGAIIGAAIYHIISSDEETLGLPGLSESRVVK